MSEPSTDLQPGATVGEYLVDRKLGEGGMGAVYAGHHPLIGKRVAIKVLSRQCAAVPDLVRRFVEEARAVNRIGHPNIIDIFSFGELEDKRPYFVMEFLDGTSLAARIEAGTLAPDETRRLLRQVCGALEAAHRAGIVHRDLKPENIWVATPQSEESYVKVLDFGIAKLVDNQQAGATRTGAAMGTPRYMAPEQCLGRSVDRRADIYAFGVMLYEMFAGVVPFRGESLGELVYQHVSELPAPPSQHRPMSPELERIILDCLEKEPAKRPEFVRDVARRLEAVLGGGASRPSSMTVAARPSEPSGPSSTTLGQSAGQLDAIAPVARRRRWPIATVSVAAVLAVGAGLWMAGRRSAAVAPSSVAVVPVPGAVVPAALAPAAASPAGRSAGGDLELRIANGRAERIALDGKEVGRETSELAVQRLSPGDHTVVIEAAGRPPETRIVTIADGKVFELSIELPPPGARHMKAATHPSGGRTPEIGAAAAQPSSVQPTPPAIAEPKPTRAHERGLVDENPLRNR